MPKKKEVKGAYQRGHRWQVDTSYKGIRIRELVATPEMAEKIIRKAQTQIDEDRYLEIKRKPKVTLGQFSRRYLKWCEIEGQKAVWDKKKRLNRMVAYFGAENLLGDITTESLEKYKEQRLCTPGPKGKRIQPATFNRELAYFKHMFSKAMDWGVLTENPTRRVKLLRETNRSLRFLTGKEIEQVTKAASPYMREVITVAVNTGLRQGELLSLKWSSVDLKACQIELLDQKNGKVSYPELNQAAQDALRRVPRRIDSLYVFSKPDGRPPVDFRRTFYKAIKKAGIPQCRFHDLRHTFASHLAMSGVDILTIKELMRHKTLAMTLRYAHLSNQHTRSAVNGLTFERGFDSEATAKTS